MTSILVTYATRMGATGEIATIVGDELRAAGFTVHVASCDENPPAGSYDAVVVGSAVYVGQWDRRATSYLREHVAVLAGLPVWLFQSGPCGDGAEHELIAVPRRVRRLVSEIGAQPPITFGGRLDQEHATGRLTRWMATGSLAGDYRDFDAVRSWAREIAQALGVGPDAAAPTITASPTISD